MGIVEEKNTIPRSDQDEIGDTRGGDDRDGQMT